MKKGFRREIKSTAAKEYERLRWGIKGGDSAKGQRKMHEGEKQKLGGTEKDDRGK